jgi:hypothetical protein
VYFAGAWKVPVFDAPQLYTYLKMHEEFAKNLMVRRYGITRFGRISGLNGK